jgi:hypothetical protein
MGQADPACCSSSPFMMGQDSHGNWVVRDQTGDCGGLFVDRAAALKFAMFESGNHPRAVIIVPGVFELDMRRSARSLPHRDTVSHYKRRAA